ncbi:hypothetical protein N657DRAFT_646558 [Parathielavia appendiculata]|uniref:Uncharacterized protein n=1 Tax=Parathielavia appendiculata TaxID=2587402 RepID=A0AAN6TXX3_9PEZI|nr:hypothetical protein N657DRAFT_646558 [Parathielavia appendiculata]
MTPVEKTSPEAAGFKPSIPSQSLTALVVGCRQTHIREVTTTKTPKFHGETKQREAI